MANFAQVKRTIFDRAIPILDVINICTENQIYFVTRLKCYADSTGVDKRGIPANRNILSDELIDFNGHKAIKRCPYQLFVTTVKTYYKTIY